MKFWAVTHRHTAYVEAETEEAAREDCAQQVRENAEPSECDAEEVTQEEYDEHWERQMKAGAK
jgi:hypothetical protein